MNLSIWLLTTALGAGGPMEMPVEVSAQTTPVPQQQVIYTSSSPMMYSAPPQRRGILNRLGLFRHNDEEMIETAPSAGNVVYVPPQPTLATTSKMPVVTQPIPVVTQPMPVVTQSMPMVSQPMPVVSQPMPVVVQSMPMAAQPMPVGPATIVTTSEPPRAATITPVSLKQPEAEVKKEFQKKVGHADDYSWITGQLFYVHADGGMWVLRYASVGEEDRFGGSPILAPAVNMRNYREGDLVSVNGEVLDQGRASRHLGGCLYRASNVELIERAD